MVNIQARRSTNHILTFPRNNERKKKILLEPETNDHPPTCSYFSSRTSRKVNETQRVSPTKESFFRCETIRKEEKKGERQKKKRNVGGIK